MRLISIEEMYELDYESGGVKPKEFIDLAIKNHASIVITSHNHPRGPFAPSQGDRATNSAINFAFNSCGLIHAEHYIVCGESYLGINNISSLPLSSPNQEEYGKFISSKKRSTEKLLLSSTSNTERRRSSKFKANLPPYNLRDINYFTELLSYVSKEPEKLAKTLLTKYHTIENVITASANELMTVADKKVAIYLKLLAYVCSRRVTEKFALGKKHTQAQISEYLKALFLGQSCEMAYIMTFDKESALTSVKLLCEGTVNSSEILPRKAIEVAISQSAKTVAIAHNHPFGAPTPSATDVQMTGTLYNLLANCDVQLKEHYIVAGQLCELITWNAL